VKGIVHDISSTGKTVFIEPFDTIEINNRVADLEQQEKLETDRILRELTSALRPFSEHFSDLHHIIEQMDLNLGKALYSRKTGSHIPALKDEPYLELKNTVHQLLSIQNTRSGKKTIPFDLILNRENRILVISGPNAGGKTVCMKSIGLLQMMVQTGIPVTTDADSVFGIFDTILVDIGDSQSIEYELSTYSSRLKLMKMFLENAGERTLFLIDEFGTGTDPSLGGALAESVLNALNEKHTFGVITTHYLNLKVMADKTEGIINGSMEFDLKRLKPLYRLVAGKPGSSYTFIVAERSGLPKEVIKDARKKIPRKTMGLEKLLSKIESDKSTLSKLKSETELRESQLKEMISKYEKLSEQTKKEGQAKSDKLKKSEERIKKEYEEKFKDFLKEWRKAKDKKEVIDKYYRQFVKSKSARSGKAEKKRIEERVRFMKEHLKPGMTVRLINGHTKGVVEKVGQKSAFVQFGEFRTKCDLSTLEIPETRSDD
jgi:DNA mismatch repair protein MutS2